MMGLGGIVSGVAQFYVILIIVYVLMSWLPMNGETIQDVYRVLGSLVEPYLGLFRRFIPPMGGWTSRRSWRSSFCSSRSAGL